jgi:hypothetical protein
MQDNRRIPASRQHIGAGGGQLRADYARQQHHEVTLPGRNPLHEDIVQTTVRPHPAIAGPHLLPGASIGDISPIDDGTPLILEWTR